MWVNGMSDLDCLVDWCQMLMVSADVEGTWQVPKELFDFRGVWGLRAETSYLITHGDVTRPGRPGQRKDGSEIRVTGKAGCRLLLLWPSHNLVE